MGNEVPGDIEMKNFPPAQGVDIQGETERALD